MIRSTTRTGLLLLALAGPAAASAACDVSVGDGNFNLGLASGRAADQWSRTYTLPATGSFELRNINGSLTFEASPDDGKLEVKAERIAKSSSDEAARELLKQIEIHEEVAPDRVLVETRAPKTWGRDGHEVKYTVRVPKGIRIQARNTNGGIDLRQLSNDVSVTTTNGGINGQGVAGKVEANTTNGGVDLALGDVTGVTARTVNGGVSLQVPADTRADLSAQVVNGGIHVDDALKFEPVGEQNRRHVEGRLNGGGRRIDVSTTNGGVSVHAR